MKKKLFLVALMAALSTTGYGAMTIHPIIDPTIGDGTVADHIVKENIDKINSNFKDVSLELMDQIIKQEETEALDKEQNGRLDGLEGQMSEALGNISGIEWDNKQQQAQLDKHEEALANKADKGEINDLYSKVEAVEGENNRVNEEQNGRLDGLEGQMSETLGNIAGIDWDNKQQQAQLDKHEEALANKADKGEINDLHAKVEAVEKENERVNEEQNNNIKDNTAAIEDLKDSKLDKDTYETDKAAQKVTDDNQNSKIEANSQAIEANKNAITETNKQVEANKNAISSNTNRIENLETEYAQVNGRVSGLEKRVDHLDEKMNKGLSLMAAMNAVDFQNVQTGEVALGAGIGHYGNAQSVALGVAYSPVEDLTVNAKYSVTAGSPDSFAVGAGATYKFKVGR